MMYLSARQMWHDAYYQRSANDAMLEMQRADANLLRRSPVMDETQTRGPADNGKKVVHMVMAGKVQSVIAKLPTKLQAFGNYCWAPRTKSHPSYRDQHIHMATVAKTIKTAYPARAHKTTELSIIIVQCFRYEYERAHGRKTQQIETIIAGALNTPRERVQKEWGDVIKAVRELIRSMSLDADESRELDAITTHLYADYLQSGGKPLGDRGMTLARLAIKDFAHRDQAYLFSAGEERGEVQPAAPLYTQQYICWRIRVQPSNYKSGGYADAYAAMLSICDDYARDALRDVSEVKNLH